MPENPNPAPEPVSSPAAAAAPAPEQAALPVESSETVAGGLEPKIAATICCVFPIVGSLVFLVLEKQNKFVRFWAMQSLLLGALAFVVGIFFTLAQ